MKIVIWLLFVLGTLAGAFWLGGKMGASAAEYRSQSPFLSGEARAHAQGVLAQIEEAQSLKLQAVQSAKINGSTEELAGYIQKLKSLEQAEQDRELRRYTDFDLAMVYVVASVVSEGNQDRTAADTYMNQAQPIFQLLGWQDDSWEALKAAAVRQFGPFSSAGAASAPAGTPTPDGSAPAAGAPPQGGAKSQ